MALTTPSGQPSDNSANDFRGASIPNVIGYKFTELDPGSNIYVQRDDKLVIQCISFTSAEVFNINVRLLQPGRHAGRTQPDQTTQDNPLGDSPVGAIVPINIMAPVSATNTLTTKVVDLAEGYLLSVGVSSTVVSQRGQSFARVYLIRGTANTANVAYLLCADYVTQQIATGWPFGNVLSPLDGQGWMQSFAPANPAAGADWAAVTLPFIRYRMRYAQGTLTTSAAVANRLVTGQIINENSLAVGTFPANIVIPATTVAVVTFAVSNIGPALAATTVNVNMPDPFMYEPINGNGPRFAVATQNLQAGDQWSNIRYLQEQWYDL